MKTPKRHIYKNTLNPKGIHNIISMMLLLLVFLRYVYIMLHFPYGFASLTKFLTEVQGIGRQPSMYEVFF